MAKSRAIRKKFQSRSCFLNEKNRANLLLFSRFSAV